MKLIKAQAAMKTQAEKQRKDVSYNVGDWIYVHLQPYRQLSIFGTTYTKHAKHYYGPYKIIECVGVVAYKLELPSHSKIYPVFHCALLKQHKGPPLDQLEALPPTFHDHHPLIQPLTILQSKWDQAFSPPIQWVLVQWMGLSPERWDELSQSFHLEDKVIFPRDGNDSATNHTEATNNENLTDEGKEEINYSRPKRNQYVSRIRNRVCQKILKLLTESKFVGVDNP